MAFKRSWVQFPSPPIKFSYVVRNYFFSYFNNKSSNNWLSDYIKYVGTSNLNGHEDEVIGYLKECGLKKGTLSQKLGRLRKEFDKAKAIQMSIKNISKIDKTESQLYNELKELALNKEKQLS